LGPAAFRPTITRGLALSVIFLQENFMMYLAAISMPMVLYRSNPLMFKGIVDRIDLNENKGSDTHRYGKAKIWHSTFMIGTMTKGWIQK
jgi:hypothetical protein